MTYADSNPVDGERQCAETDTVKVVILKPDYLLCNRFVINWGYCKKLAALQGNCRIEQPIQHRNSERIAAFFLERVKEIPFANDTTLPTGSGVHSPCNWSGSLANQCSTFERQVASANDEYRAYAPSGCADGKG